ncbi:MAG: type II secretion system protein GspG [Planctomycetes bacterium]|nr:type II secretion system protein GspG [Planctomycetota bacterium]
MLVVVQDHSPGGVPVRCALCHDAFATFPPPCPGCRTLVHADCRAGVACPTLGCPQGRAGRAVVEPWQPRAPRRRRWWPGVLIGAALGGWCLAVVLVNVVATSITCHVERERADFRALHDAADLFRIDRGRCPERMDELRDHLRECPPLDPWGNPYALQPHARGVAFVSPGPDGALGTEDDLHSHDVLFEAAR